MKFGNVEFHIVQVKWVNELLMCKPVAVRWYMKSSLFEDSRNVK